MSTQQQHDLKTQNSQTGFDLLKLKGKVSIQHSTDTVEQ
jgi:hypothetical protein